MIANPETPRKIPLAAIEKTLTPETNINLFHLLGWNNMQLERLGDGLDPDLELPGGKAATAFKALEAENFAALLRKRSARGRARGYGKAELEVRSCALASMTQRRPGNISQYIAKSQVHMPSDVQIRLKCANIMIVIYLQVYRNSM